MKITFKIEADSAEEFAQALAVISKQGVVSCKELDFQPIISGTREGLAVYDAHTGKEEVISEKKEADYFTGAIVKDTVRPDVIISLDPGTTVEEKPKRTRRTKAELEADLLKNEVPEQPQLTAEQVESFDNSKVIPNVNSEKYLDAQAGITKAITSEKPITLDDLRLLCFPINKLGADGKAAIVSMLKDHGITALGQIPESEYPAYDKEIRALAKSFNIEYV